MKAEPRNCIGLQEVVSDSCSETCLVSPHDGSQLIKAKVEDVTDIKEEEDPVQITSPTIKSECENVDIIKTEDDVDVLGEDDSTGMIPDEFYVPSSFSTLKTEPKNVNIISVENDTDVLSEEHSTGLQTDKVYIPSAFSTIKAEHREVVSVSCSETCLVSPHDGSQLIKAKVEDVTDIKEEEDPVQITFPTIKAECESYLQRHSGEHP
ncbi:uncharacterized protein LOC110831502 isoform X2 [Zootermopsis nevadensis]|uniref:uncharacterized protein LOC110831502 isoform X2 n=1 Tax=Zootermopsis nevadensis TaxID=136037 RepID=UPI000B8EC12F|nr:uncharacterized protein LOC110831502 isoform X2 [Zootermopsis nevadensis]